MIDDFTKFNGATRLVSNSHKINAFPKYKKKYKKEKIIEGKKRISFIIKCINVAWKFQKPLTMTDSE